MIKVLVFDCDGVILESVEVKSRAYAKLFERYGPEAMARIVGYHLEHGGLSRVKKIAWFYREVLGREITPEENEALAERFGELCLANVLASPFVPGAMEFIARHSSTYPLYAASGTPEPELLDVFEQRGLTPHFKGIYGSPPVKTDILARIIDQEGVRPGEVLFVGDSATDLRAAKATGTRFVGRGSFDPSYPWVEDLTGLDEHLQRLSKQGG